MWNEEVLATVINGLRAKPMSKGRWQARCPAHDDRQPSLSIAAGRDGNVLLYCHRGCTHEAVLNALRDRGLWPKHWHRLSRPQGASVRVETSYDANDKAYAAQQLKKARWLWQCSVPGSGTPVERYLTSRGIPGRVPSCLRFLSPRNADQHPAMIAAFGLAKETRPGNLIIAPSQVMGIHLTLLKPDGRGKAGTPRDKLMIGRSSGWPIVVAPVNDLGGLAITEGIEDALSLHRATGLGAWGAGAADRLPKLGRAVPLDAECVTIVVDDDAAGRRGSLELARSLSAQGIEVIMVTPRSERKVAA